MNLKIAAVLGCAILSTMALAQSPTSSPTRSNAQAPTLYDNFNGRFLSSAKWNVLPACFTSNSRELECVRTIQDGQLLLAHRNFGQRDSDAGFQFGFASVRFSRSAAIKGIMADLVVHDIEEVGCTANPELGGQIGFDANFFNAGSGKPSDDVGGHLFLGRILTDPAGQLTVFAQISQGLNYFAYFPLGTVTMGTPVTLTLTWDQPNHQFIATWINRETNVTTQVLMPYSLSDTTPAVNPGKYLTVNTFPADCTANAAWVYAAGSFDNVYIQ